LSTMRDLLARGDTYTAQRDSKVVNNARLPRERRHIHDIRGLTPTITHAQESGDVHYRCHGIDSTDEVTVLVTLRVSVRV
jgi:hypothetical protein